MQEEATRALAHRPPHERVRALAVLAEPFSVEAGTLTRTMKPKRQVGRGSAGPCKAARGRAQSAGCQAGACPERPACCLQVVFERYAREVEEVEGQLR